VYAGVHLVTRACHVLRGSRIVEYG
jgi:hypothetical protein